MTIIDAYEKEVSEGLIQNDPAQLEALKDFQRVADDLNAPMRSWRTCFRKRRVQGLYLYGPVGVGKTFLGDLFFDNVQEKRKARFHFHHFMQQIDTQLRRLQGKKDPLRKIAAKFAKKVRLLCFDEFMVYDVADAMILEQLLGGLFEHGVVLVATSNSCPDSLYQDGPQRDRFLPAIELLKTHCQLVTLAPHSDYRLGREPFKEAYFYPLNKEATLAMTKLFNASTLDVTDAVMLKVQNRKIPAVKCGSTAVWFRFDVICNLPRSQLDYLEIADRFDRVFVSDIPVLTEHDTVRVILFIHFIDVMYDRGIQLILSAAAALDALYLQGEMKVSFQRALSRLEEMRSKDYVARHLKRHIQSL